jgi:DNA-binding PucR family transcriptional regulator
MPVPSGGATLMIDSRHGRFMHQHNHAAKGRPLIVLPMHEEDAHRLADLAAEITCLGTPSLSKPWTARESLCCKLLQTPAANERNR